MTILLIRSRFAVRSWTQMSYIFPIGGKLSAYLDLKAPHRTARNTWRTFAISPASEPPTDAKLFSRKY